MTGKKKLASIGVALRGGVSYHGFSLNMNNSLSPFKLIHPCRLEADTMTSLAMLRGEPLDEAAVTEAVGRALLQYFGRPEKIRAGIYASKHA